MNNLTAIILSERFFIVVQLKAMLDADNDVAPDLKSVVVYSVTQMDDNVVVAFTVNLDSASVLNDTDILAAFTNGLTGVAFDTVPPDNKIVPGSTDVTEAG